MDLSEINDKFFYFEETINYLKNKIQSLIDEFHNEKKELKEENQKLREEITSYQYQNFSYEQILRNPEEKKNSYIFWDFIFLKTKISEIIIELISAINKP